MPHSSFPRPRYDFAGAQAPMGACIAKHVRRVASLGMMALAGVVTGCGSDALMQNAQGIHVASAQKSLLSHAPDAIRDAAVKERVDGEHVLKLRLALELQDEDGLDGFLQGLYSPDSSDYGHYLSPTEFRVRYAPALDQVVAAKTALANSGIDVVATEGHGTVLLAQAKAKDAERFFDTEIYHYEASDGRAFHAPARPVKIAENLHVQAVHGLSTPPTYKPRVKESLSKTDKTFDAAAVRAAYNIPATSTGKGQIIGLVELDGYNAADVETYAKNNGIRAVPLKNILLDGFTGAVQDTDAQVEVTMDIELINALAPDADEIRVYEASNAGNGFFDIFTEIANPTQDDKKLISNISCSWGAPEEQMSDADAKSESNLFKQMAAQGQTFFAAAGDDGARDDGHSLSVDDPASQPWVVAVGGTTLSMDKGAWSKESTWSGGGGGISKRWAIPAWQKGLQVNAHSKVSTTHRNVPDVSLDANPETGYEVFVAGHTFPVGGTSCAAPLWAAFWALVDEARQHNSMPQAGFASPTLYDLGRSASYASDFHDVKDKSSNGYYHAVEGFDDATGWGSFNGANMIKALSTPPTK